MDLNINNLVTISQKLNITRSIAPNKNEAETPRAATLEDIAVAVVRWYSGNQRAEMTGQAAIKTGPPRPLKNWPM